MQVPSLLLVLNQENISKLWATHLNTGGGWAWAWHKRTMACCATFVRVVLLNSKENDGALDPIGSVTNTLNIIEGLNTRISYLNTGTGNACAWHKRAKPWPVLRVIPENWTSFENVGDFEPTGSTIENIRYNLFTWTLVLEKLELDIRG